MKNPLLDFAVAPVAITRREKISKLFASRKSEHSPKESDFHAGIFFSQEGQGQVSGMRVTALEILDNKISKYGAFGRKLRG